MAVSVTFNGRRSGGKLYLKDGKTEYEFSSPAEAFEWAQNVLRSGGKEILVAMGLMRLREVSPDGSNLAAIQGRTITYDPTINNIVRVVP